MVFRRSTLLSLLAILALASVGGFLPSIAHSATSAKNTGYSAQSSDSSSAQRSFSRDTLYSLLTAEIAGSRQMYDIALREYVKQARATRDPQVAARATMIARYLEDAQTSLEMALIWANSAPKDKEALGNASIALMQAGRLNEAFSLSKKLYNLGGEPLFQNIAANAASLNAIQREKLLQSYKTLIPNYTHDEQVLVGTGLLLQQQEHFEEAMSYVRKALNQYPRSIPAAILEANLLHELNRDREAIYKMGELLTYYPDNTSLRTQYAHILTHYDMALAQQQFAILTQQQPQNADALLSLGIVAMQRKDYRAAIKAFEKLLEDDTHQSTAHYYLGRIAEAQENWQEAIFNYLQVEQGNDFLPATLSLLDIFIKRGDFISAQQHMNRVRNRFPEQAESLYLLHSQALVKHSAFAEAEKVLNDGMTNVGSNKLLYARAMLALKRNQAADAERDLRIILLSEPDNAIALNSLGYLLTDTSLRYKEAEELLVKAQRLKPEDPVIMDSLGWLYFRQGKSELAIQWLRRALSNYKEPAVYAHLGEALWVSGTKEAREEARLLWQEGIQKSPEDPQINITMKRLKVEP